jgi:tetratricopeptide (TPR) repeat protein
LLGAKRYSEAEACAAELTGQYPDCAAAWKALGLSRFMQGKDALLALQHAARLLPEEAGAQHDLGVAARLARAGAGVAAV